MPKPLDITNQKFNKLTAIKPLSERTLLRRIQWLCKCDCGKFVISTAVELKSGQVKSCGCIRRSEKLTNKKIDRLLVTELLEDNGNNTNTIYLCKCDCGNTKQYSHSSLMSGRVKSCGCLNKELQQKFKDNLVTHGLSSNPCYRVWVDMIKRCTNENSNNYYNYGGRGITVCNEWLNSFEKFYKDMGERPGPEYSIDRKDTNGNYEPNNCKWSTDKEQANNRRNNVIIEYLGEKYTMVELCKKLDIDLIYFRNRYYRNFTIDEIINSYKKKG